MEPNSGRILAAEFVGTAVLVMGGPGTAILAPRPRTARRGARVRPLAAGHGVRDRPDQRLPHQPGGHAGDAADEEDRHSAARSSRGSPRCIGGIFGALVISGIASGRDGLERGGFASNGWDRDGFSGLGAAIIVEIVFTALLVFVVLSTTAAGSRPGSAGSSPASR